MPELNNALDDYRRKRDSFVWEVPKSFNFARDVVDRCAADPNRPATLYRDVHGVESRITFGQMSDWVHRFAGLLEQLGVGRGERGIVLLPRIPEGQITTVGTLGSGIGR